MRVLFAAAVLALCACASSPATRETGDPAALHGEYQALLAKGDYLGALPVAQRELAAAQQAARAPEVATALEDLGGLESALSRYPDATRHLAAALEMRRQDPAGAAATAAALGLVARNEDRQGHYAAAIENYEAALAQQAPGSAAAATTQLGLAHARIMTADYDAAAALLQQVMAVREQPGAAPLELARTLTLRAFLSLYNGDDDGAGKDLARALAIVDTPDSQLPELALALNYQADAYIDLGQYQDAEKGLQRALGIFEASLGPETQEAANCLNDLARAYEDDGHYPQAESYYLRSIALYSRLLGDDDVALAEVRDNLAQMYDTVGAYPKAEPLYKQAIAAHEKAGDAALMSLAYDLNNYAQHLEFIGRYAEAEPLMRRELEIFQKILPADHEDIATAINNLGELYEAEGKYAEAEPLMKEALERSIKAHGRESRQAVYAMGNLSLVYKGERRYDLAEPLLREALATDMRVMRAGHPDIAWLSHNLANLYSDEGKYREADPLFERAVAMISATYGKDSLEAQKYVVDYAIDQYAQGRWAKADALYGGYFSRMRRIYAGLFQYLGEKDRLSFTSLLKGNVETYFSLCLKYHDAAPQLAGEMYDVLLWHKGLVGGSIAALRARIAASGDPEALALLDRLSEQKTRLAGLLGSPGEDHAAWQAEVRQQQQRADDLEKQLVQRSASLRQEEGLQQVSWQQVRDTLKPGEAAVELVRFRFDDGRNAPGPLQYRYVALVLRPGMRGPQFIEIGKADARLDAAVAEYSAHLGRFGAPPPATVTFYQAFWQPLEPALAGVQRIYLSPDGIYNQASLGIVPDGGGRLLMERYDLHVLPSTRDLARAPDRREGASAVLVGGPDFALSPGGYLAAVSRLQQAPGASGPLLAVQAAPGASQLSRDAFAGGKCPQPGAGILCPLPGAAEEVESVRDLLGAKQWQATLYAGDSALEEAVRAVHHPRLLHIATHGFFLPDQRAGAGSAEDPMLRSGLYLAGADNALAGNLPPEGADNGILTAYEAEQLDLGGTELVVLSACDTGLGTSQSGEGVFGLNRALQEAGAQAVLMSMWSVPDQETRELMQLFYRNWLGGMEKHEALRQAELTERDVVKQRYGHDLPYYWGAFVMVGR